MLFDFSIFNPTKINVYSPVSRLIDAVRLHRSDVLGGTATSDPASKATIVGILPWSRGVGATSGDGRRHWNQSCCRRPRRPNSRQLHAVASFLLSSLFPPVAVASFLPPGRRRQLSYVDALKMYTAQIATGCNRTRMNGGRWWWRG